MAVKKTNTRITITISKKQYAWLDQFSRNKNIRMSKLIGWLIFKKTSDVKDTLHLNTNPEEEIEKIENQSLDEDENLTDEEFKAKYLNILNEHKKTGTD